jgi:hypothetical protein
VSAEGHIWVLSCRGLCRRHNRQRVSWWAA